MAKGVRSYIEGGTGTTGTVGEESGDWL